MKIFFYDADTEAQRDEYEGDLDEAINEFYELSDVKGSFFGLVNETGKVVQFAWMDDDKWTIDIPLPEQGGSLSRYGDYELCQQVIIDYFNGISPELLAGLKFEKF
jgi:hypothetical protein